MLVELITMQLLSAVIPGSGSETICQVYGLKAPHEFRAKADENGIALLKKNFEAYDFQVLVAKNKINSLKIERNTGEAENSLAGLNAQAAFLELQDKSAAVTVRLECALPILEQVPKIAENDAEAVKK